MFPIFDKFDESNFEVDNQELTIGVRTISTINRPYVELGTLKTWTHGEQEADENLNIITRTYAELMFDEAACDFDFNDAGFEDDTYGGRYYWRVIHKFTEHEYYSENSAEYENFRIWEESFHRFELDIIYKHEVRETIEWLRPRTNQAKLTSGNPPQSSCPIGGSTPGDDNKTGDSAWFEVGIGITATCRKFNSVNIPYYKVFDVGGALGAVVKGDQPDNVYIFDIDPVVLQQVIDDNSTISALLQPLLESVDYRNTNNPVTLADALSSVMTSRGLTAVSTGSFTDPIRLRQRFLILEYTNPTKTFPQDGSIDLYANEFYRSFLPLSRDQEPLFPEHAPGTPFIVRTNDNVTITRYKPPSRPDFPDNFWNDVNIDTIDSYGSRVGLEGNDLV